MERRRASLSCLSGAVMRQADKDGAHRGGPERYSEDGAPKRPRLPRRARLDGRRRRKHGLRTPQCPRSASGILRRASESRRTDSASPLVQNCAIRTEDEQALWSAAAMLPPYWQAEPCSAGVCGESPVESSRAGRMPLALPTMRRHNVIRSMEHG